MNRVASRGDFTLEECISQNLVTHQFVKQEGEEKDYERRGREKNILAWKGLQMKTRTRGGERAMEPTRQETI